MSGSDRNGHTAHYPGADADSAWRRLVAPADYENPRARSRYHLVVIGAGPAGLVTAIAAAGLGARVALVERQAMGGDCLNVGCVPSKSLLEFSAHTPDFAAAFAWLRTVRARIAENDSVTRYRDAGVDVFLGEARFHDGSTVAVGDQLLVGRRFVIATGAHAVLPPIPGLEASRPLTNETVFDLVERPERLAIIGAGAVGCELAQAFARLGVAVDLLEVADRVLPGETPQASRILAAALTASGVTLHLGATVDSVARRTGRYRLTTSRGEIASDTLLVAAGRRANTDLNLPAAHVELTDSGRVRVDDHLRTSNRKIYAAGDVCSDLQLTHNADAQARIVVQNALFVPTASARGLIVPRCTYTTPEVAQVGRSRGELEQRGEPFDVYTVPYDELDRGRAQGDDQGFVEILTQRSRPRILGATIVGRDAGEQIAAVCIALRHGLGIDDFAKVVLPYPTRAEALRRIGDEYNRTRLTPTASRLLATWLKWTL
jgi:pyruvate/2-oxoglutarate dehydrogenase complex dihydrolipoamide dehydrogenase (E3) component